VEKLPTKCLHVAVRPEDHSKKKADGCFSAPNGSCGREHVRLFGTTTSCQLPLQRRDRRMPANFGERTRSFAAGKLLKMLEWLSEVSKDTGGRKMR
jgi:hypothetical protein